MIVDNQQQQRQRNDMIKTTREDRKIEKALVRLPRMIEEDDYERFTVSMEKLLTQEDIPYDQWKQANLTQKARDMVADVTDDPDSTFQPITTTTRVFGSYSYSCWRENFLRRDGRDKEN